jgi:hypothetical protein
VEIASSVGLHKKDLRCRARVEVFRVTCGSERVRDGRASDAVPDGGYERDGDVAHDASFPIAFAPRDGGERGLGRGLGGGVAGGDSTSRTVIGEIVKELAERCTRNCTVCVRVRVGPTTRCIYLRAELLLPEVRKYESTCSCTSVRPYVRCTLKVLSKYLRTKYFRTKVAP